MNISDNELGMLEQLCYIDPELIEMATGQKLDKEVLAQMINGSKNCRIDQLLTNLGLTDEALDNLAALGDKQIGGAWVSGAEWAGILSYLKNSDLKYLELSDTMTSDTGQTVLAMCFTEKGNSSDAIVAFKGTSEDEWVDNVEGLNISDTDAQKEALDYIESLSYDSVTVTGHSKGGNKAMYVMITSDKVIRCVSYDGQGFSQEFIDKYWAEIQECGKSITNYSLSTDYVHALMFPVPNSNQVYCVGYGVDNIGQHHSPNSFFATDEYGKLILDENGKPIVLEISENESITMLHSFTTFVLNNASQEDKIEIVNFLAPMLAMVFRGGDDITTDDLINYILDNSDDLALILAYLVKYMDEYNLNSDDIDILLDSLGLNSLNELITIVDFDAFGYHVDVNLNLANIINYIKNQLNDNNDDELIKYFLLPVLKTFFAGDYDIDISAFWEKINSKVKEIDTSKGCIDAKARIGTVRDFSAGVYEILMNVINRIENVGGGLVSTWNSYANEEWYSSLFVSIAIKGINAYFSKLTETNQICKTRIDTVFNNIKTIDDTAAVRLLNHCQGLQRANTYITSVANNIIG